MPKFTGTFNESFTVAASPEAVRAHFLDTDAIIEHFGDLESAEKLDDHTVRYLMEEQNHGIFSFQGRYTCRYEADGEDGSRWESQGDDGNIWTHGSLTVAPGDAPGTTKLDYQAEMTLEIDLNPMLATALAPVVKASIPSQMKDYVKRMIKAAEAK